MCDTNNKSTLTGKLGRIHMYLNNEGDTWQSAWLNDDRVFALACDTPGWYGGAGPNGSNMCINELTGDFHKVDGLDGKTFQGMTTHPFHFGYWGAMKYDGDGLRRMWKANSLSYSDGSLYMSVSRHGEMIKKTNYIQDSMNANIIRSDDYGETWSMTEDECYANPMFPGFSFPLPCFIKYYRDNEPVPCNDGEKYPHDSDKYFYAVSNDGFWNNGTHLYLGRIKRDKMRDMKREDWQYFSGTPGINNEDSWSHDPTLKMPLISSPLKIGMPSVQYVWPLKRYVLVNAYYPEPYRESFDTTYTRFRFYEAPAPYGPWTMFFESDCKGTGYYTPEILTKSIKSNDDGSCSMIFLTAGDWVTNSKPDSIYRMTAIELTLI